MRFVFDLDETICIARNRDYANAEPLFDVISNIRNAKKMGATIVIHTARGMLSCGGNVKKAEAKNRPVIEEWLKRYDVPCDELIFGKPYADLYVDDKGISLMELQQTGFTQMQGFSGAKVWRVGNRVIKEQADCKEIREWYDEAYCTHTDLNVPTLITAGNGVVQLEYIDGQLLGDCVTWREVEKVADAIISFSYFDKDGRNDVKNYVEYVESRSEGHWPQFLKRLRSANLNALSERTFCHGDMSLRNIIKDKYNQLWMFDPSIKECSSWLLDASKFRASLNGLDEAIGNGVVRNDLLTFFDNFFTNEQLEIIKLLEVTHMIRVQYYARKLGKRVAEEILRNHIQRLICD